MQCVTILSLSLLAGAMSVMLRTNVTYAVCHTKCVVSIVCVNLSNDNKAYNVFYSCFYSTVARYSSQAYWINRLASRCKKNRFPV